MLTAAPVVLIAAPAVLTAAPESQVQADRSKPIYRGVSVRSSRTRAGLFSRRQQPLEGGDAKDEHQIDDTETDELEVVRKPESTESIKGRRSISPSSANPNEKEKEDDESSEPSPPVFTKTGYYVEESDKKEQVQSKATALDPWSSFLNELSKVEDQFFNLTATKKKPDKSKNGKNRSSLRRAASSDSESLEPPPPAPRTFYA